MPKAIKITKHGMNTMMFNSVSHTAQYHLIQLTLENCNYIRVKVVFYSRKCVILTQLIQEFRRKELTKKRIIKSRKKRIIKSPHQSKQ